MSLTHQEVIADDIDDIIKYAEEHEISKPELLHMVIDALWPDPNGEESDAVVYVMEEAVDGNDI